MSNKPPYQITGETSCIPTGVNECNVITLFQMGVDCNVSHPTQPDSTDGIVSLTITGGTPPYVVTWSNGGVGPIIYGLSAGSYGSTVVDYYGDFTANTVCVLTGITPTTTTTSTTTTSPYPNEYEMCLTTEILIGSNIVVEQIHFNPNGMYDGKPTWVSDDSLQSIIWDSSQSQWLVSAATPTLYVISNLNPTYPPVYGGWLIIGASGSAMVNEGNCTSFPGTSPLLGKFKVDEVITPLTMNVTKNQTICGCDGGITINANGGSPPYTYSINSGLTYKNIPIFNNLCSGTYRVITMDSNEITNSLSVIINSPSKPTTYNVGLNTTSKIIERSNNSVTKQYETTIKIFPPLPDGVLLTFDLSHLNTSKSSPNYESSISESNSELVLNGGSFKPSGEVPGSSETSSIIPGCQSNTVYITSNGEIWDQFTIINTDILVLTTITSVTKNESINCYIGTSDEKYSITNLKLSGCNCCTVIAT